MMINTATDTLAAHCSRHIRIIHTIAKGEIERAADLLLNRMEGTLLGFREGDFHSMPPEVRDACEVVHFTHGPLMKREMARAAYDECMKIRHS